MPKIDSETIRNFQPKTHIFAKIKLHNSSNTCWVIKRSRIFVFRFCFASLYRVSSKICSKKTQSKGVKNCFIKQKSFRVLLYFKFNRFSRRGRFLLTGKIWEKAQPSSKARISAGNHKFDRPEQIERFVSFSKFSNIVNFYFIN